jgi:hypothetical protein
MNPRELVAAAAALRSQVRPARADEDDVLDPMGGGPAHHDAMIAIAQRAMISVAACLHSAAEPHMQLIAAARRH